MHQRLHGPRSPDAFPMWVYAVTLALAILVIVGGFRSGVSSQSNSDSGIVRQVAREKYIRKQTRQCEDEIASREIGAGATEEQRAELDNLRAVTRGLVEGNDRLREADGRLHAQVVECQEKAEAEARAFDDDDAAAATRLHELETELEDARDAVKRIQDATRGSRRAMILAVLAKRRAENAKLRLALGMATPEADYEDQLIARYNISASADGAPDAVPTLPRGYLQRPAGRSMSQALRDMVAVWPPFTYDPVKHSKDIFVPGPKSETADTEADVERPSFFDRTGTQPVTTGALAEAPIPPTTSLYASLRDVARLALCAKRNGFTSLAYPDWIYREVADPKDDAATPALAALSTVIDTPLVAFCEKCRSPLTGREFALACASDTTDLLYGGLDFWSARSLVRFAPSVMVAAGNFAEDNELVMNTTMGVVYRRGPAWQATCESAVNGLPMRHYARVVGSASENETIYEASPDSPAAQCAPSIEDLQRAIIQFASQNEHVDTVLIATDMALDDDDELQQLDVGALHVVVVYPTSLFEDAVQLVALSQTSVVLVNRFGAFSQEVTELYQMRHGFDNDGIGFF